MFTAKISELLNSMRFWQVTAATAFVLLGHYLPGLEFLWNTLAAYLATVAGVGTLDSVASRFAGTKVDAPATQTPVAEQ